MPPEARYALPPPSAPSSDVGRQIYRIAHDVEGYSPTDIQHGLIPPTRTLSKRAHGMAGSPALPELIISLIPRSVASMHCWRAKAGLSSMALVASS